MVNDVNVSFPPSAWNLQLTFGETAGHWEEITLLIYDGDGELMKVIFPPFVQPIAILHYPQYNFLGMQFPTFKSNCPSWRKLLMTIFEMAITAFHWKGEFVFGLKCWPPKNPLTIIEFVFQVVLRERGQRYLWSNCTAMAFTLQVKCKSSVKTLKCSANIT